MRSTLCAANPGSRGYAERSAATAGTVGGKQICPPCPPFSAIRYACEGAFPAGFSAVFSAPTSSLAISEPTVERTDRDCPMVDQGSV